MGDFRTPVDIAEENDPKVNPMYYPYTRDDGYKGSFSQQMWYGGGRTSEFSQILLVLFFSSWLVVPVCWSMHYCFIVIKGFRSDMLAGLWWNLILAGILIPALGGFNHRDAFVWIKSYSLVIISMQVWLFKYILGFPVPSQTMMWVQTLVLYGTLMVNILEAVVWEVVVIGDQGEHIVSSVAGAILAVSCPFYAYWYGVSIVEYYDGRVRQARCNLTPTWIIAYTLWNVEYNASYHPHKAAYYTWTTLILPMGAAFWAGHDWLETRAQMLLHAAIMRVIPVAGGDGILTGTVGIWQPTFESPTFRYIFGVSSIFVSIISFVEIYYIMKGHKWFDYGLRRELMLVDMAEPHGPEAVAPVLHAYLERFGFAPLKLHVRKHTPPGFGPFGTVSKFMHKHKDVDGHGVVQVADLGTEAQVGVTPGTP